MKAFTERNPKVIGAVVVAVTAALVCAVVVLNRSIFRSGYEVSARFPTAAGIGKGTDVLLAGVKVGTVGSVTIDGNAVDATMTIDHGVVLPHETDAAIQVQTLLGVMDVSLQPVSGWSSPLRPGALLTHTSVPTELYQLRNEAGHVLSTSDAKAFNSLVQSLADITKGKQHQVAQIIQGLGALTTTVNRRSGEVSQLITSAKAVSGTLAQHDQQLATIIQDLGTVASGLATHSAELAGLIDNVDAMAAQTNGLVGQDRPQLNSLLAQLHGVLGVVGQHQDDLAQAVGYLGAALKGFASVGYSGPNDTPNSWANIYVNTVGMTPLSGVLGPCGALTAALTEILGPTPLTCSQRTGPLPGTNPSNLTPGPAVDGGAGAGAGAGGSGRSGAGSGSGSSVGSGTGSSLPAGPNSGLGGLSRLSGALAGGLAPEVVGQRVLQGMQSGEFYILTHAGERDVVKARHARIEAAFERAAAWQRQRGA